MTIAVVIPFYQKKPGLLQAALRSVIAQSVALPIHVVVVDDASPIPATSEVAGVTMREGISVQVLRQANAGPAAARNRGLDALRDNVSHVAFLDSDDVWVDDHLRHAIDALAAGHDFFFTDLYQPGQAVSAFARGGRIDASRHPSIGVDGSCHAYVGDMFDQIISGNVIGTSTVVYDFRRFRTQRFDEAFYSAGEDYLFWIAFARAGAHFCFSTDVEVHYGYGVNVYAGSGWGTDGYLGRIHNEMRYRKRLLEFDLSASQRELMLEKVSTLRIEFADDIVHRLSHRKPLPKGQLVAQIKLDPATLWMLPIHAGQIVARRIKGRLAD